MRSNLLRPLLFTLLALGSVLAPPGQAQPAIDSLSAKTATLGTVFEVTGSGFGTKPKAFLAQEGVKVKKTALKVLAVTGEEGGPQTLNIEVRKAVLGTFQVGVAPKGTEPEISEATLEIVPPSVLSVEPSVGSPGDVVTVRVANAGNRKLRSEIFKKAKVLSITPVLANGAADLTDVQVRIPNAPDGTHNLTVRNKLGSSTLKTALTVAGSSACPGKPRASVLVNGLLFKTKKVAAIETSSGLRVTVTRGPKKARQTIEVELPFDPETDAAPQTYTLAPASITYIESSNEVETGRWMTASGDGFQVIVNAIECETLLLTVCGPLTSQAEGVDEQLTLEGTIVARLPLDDVGPPQECLSMFGQVGGVAFLADDVLAGYFPALTTTVITGLDTPLNAQITVDLAYNALSEGPALFDVISFAGMRLFKYTDNGEDFFAFIPVPGIPGSSVTFEVLSNDGSCITGLFSGSVKQPVTGEVRTFNTFKFEAPLEIIN